MLDHVGFQCKDMEASAAFYDAVLATLGAKRLMDFGMAIGYGVPPKPDFWISLHNSGDGRTDATPPGVLKDASIDGSTLTFTTSGGDGPCGQAASFRVVVDGHQVAIDDDPAPSGTEQSLELGNLGPGHHSVTVQSVDEAGNASIPVSVRS